MTEPFKIPRKLIETALPLEAINKACEHEKNPGIGTHPRNLHLWWARRPAAAARAMLFAQLINDPGDPLIAKGKSENEIRHEREKLFQVIENFVKWENSSNDTLLNQARKYIHDSWATICELNNDKDPDLFCVEKPPSFIDPFSGGGAIPLEAQRMGLASAGTDLNPVAVLITKSMIEVPQKFNGLMPVSDQTSTQMHKGCEGLAKDVRYYGELLREQALSELSDLYPTAKITREMVESQPGLLEHLDKDVKVIAWLWTRTVESPNPALNGTHVPLVRSFWLANKRNRKTWLEPIIDGQSYSFQVKSGTEGPSVEGTVSRSGATCLITGSAIPFSYIREQGKQGKLGIRLLAIVAEGTRGKIYLPPNSQHEEMAGHIEVDNSPSTSLPDKALGFRVQEYGIKSHSKLFTKRQLKALVTFADLIPKLHETIRSDAEKAGLSPDQPGLDNNGRGALAYADAIAMYLSFAVDRLADFNSTICTWKSSGEQVMQTYKRQAIPMTWDFPESNILAKKSICWTNCVKYVADVLEKCFSFNNLYPGQATATDAATVDYQGKIISTDPPYYDNIGYADLSDFFYVWLRRSLKNVYPTLFQTALVPKLEELIATPFRHQSQGEAESFFMNGMKKVMGKLAKEAHPAYPVSIYYAFKQAEKSVDGLRSTGWETFLNAVIQAGFVITGTWPVRSEQATRMRNIGSNALASSIVLVCERRDIKAESVTRREFISFLKTELPPKIELLLKANIAPVDLQQAALGPGMAIFSRFDAVIESDGSKMKIGDALSIILQELEDCLSQDDSNYDGDTRWAIEWFKEYGFDEGPFGKADDLSRAKNTSVSGLEAAGICTSGKGKVKLLNRDELEPNWNPNLDERLTVWEMTHYLIKALESDGEMGAASLMTALGDRSWAAKELAFRLYGICNDNKWAKIAIGYNSLASQWSEIQRLSSEALI